MIKLTNSEWKKITNYIPLELLEEIEERKVQDSVKGEKIDVQITMANGKKKTIPGEKISPVWAITPALYKNSTKKFHKVRKSFTYIPSGESLVICKNRRACLSMWKELKNIKGINSENISELRGIREQIVDITYKYKIQE